MEEQDQNLFADRGQKRKDSHQYDAPDLTPDDYAAHTANQAANAFQATQLFEVIEVKAGVGQIHLLGRVKQDNEKDFLDKVVTPVLKVIEESNGGWECHICKQFLRKNGKTKYAWTISFAAVELRQAAHAICSAINASSPKREVLEAPLVGPSTPAGGGPRGGRKGAAPVRG